MSYQDQLAIDFMAKLATRAAVYQACKVQYDEFWLDTMDIVFNKAYQEIYGYFPHGC